MKRPDWVRNVRCLGTKRLGTKRLGYETSWYESSWVRNVRIPLVPVAQKPVRANFELNCELYRDEINSGIEAIS